MHGEIPFFVDPNASPDGPVDLVVEEGPIETEERMLSTLYSFGRDAIVVGTDSGRIRLSEGHILAEPSLNPEELYARWVEGLLFFKVLSQGAFLAHSSAVSRAGLGYFFPAWAHTGKTNVALEFVSHGYDYMADDWCLLSPAGEILGYPRWLRLFDYNFEAHPQLQSTVGGPKDRRRLSRRLALNRLAHSLNPDAAFSANIRSRLESRFSVYHRAPITRVIPGSREALRAPLTKACLLSTGRSRHVEIADLAPDELARRVSLTAMYERYMFNMDRVALAYAGMPDGPLDFAPAGEAVLRNVFARTRCFEVQLPPSPSTDDLHRIRAVIESA
ncbi:MAG TPA: hypothetical protein VEY12_03550 [Thermoplasmata archaeon]|nr:hypothetical protein [Thermoplasmata archaeon]